MPSKSPYETLKQEIRLLEGEVEKGNQAREALRKSESSLQSIFLAAPIGIGLVINRVIMQANDRMCEMTGYSRAELLNRNSRLLYMTDEDFEYVGREKYGQILRWGTGMVETRWVRKDGTAIDVLLSSTPLNPSDPDAGVTFTALDITDRKQAERELLESEQKYRNIFDRSNDAILLTQPDGTILDANPAACAMFGRSREEIRRIGRNGLVDLTDPRLQHALKERVRTGMGTAEITLLRANGDRFAAEVSSAIFVDAEGRQHTSMIIRDLSEIHRVQQDYQALFREMLEGFAVHEMIWDDQGKPVDYRFLTVNPAFERITGLKAEEIVGRTVLEVLPGTESSWIELFGRVALTGEPAFFENYAGTLDEYFDVAAFRPAPGRFAAIFTDITKRKRTEIALQQSEERYRRIAENMADVVWTTDLNFNITYVSPSVERLTGEAMEKYPLRSLQEKHPPESLERLYALFRDEMAKEQDPRAEKNRTRSIEVEHYRADGSRVWLDLNLSFIRDAEGQAIGIQGVSRDISERKKAQAVIRKNEQRLEGLLRISQYQAESTQDLLDYALDEAIQLTDSRLGYIYLYDEAEKKFFLNTWSKEVMKECAVVGAPSVYELDKTGLWGEAVRQARPVVVNDFQAPHPLKRGYPEGHAHLYKYMTVPVFNKGLIVAVAGVANKEADYEDADVRQLTLLMDSVWRITEQKKSELARHQAEEKYRNIVENALEGIFQSTREGRFLTANQAMAAILGYESPEELMKSVTDLDVQIYADQEDRRKLQMAAEKKGQVSGFETRYLRKDGDPIWVSINKRVVRDEQGCLLFYEGFVEDITSRKISMEQIRRALGATVQAIAVTVEAKDPYTAGHQRRVADLGRAIAVEMQLTAEQIEGIHMAGMVHDLGKISIPSEILSKPTRLTDLEFRLIKIHSQAGFDILKDIEFPWPIARIVLEHHERMDGSGYPYGLTGDQALLESRIISVADVVEAMASHRPYRPGLGIGAALAEIETNRGILYDPAAVDACLRLFREKNYQLTT